MKTIRTVSIFSFAANMVLFITKLYVGLSSNSISIYSDGVNNLLDSASGLLSFLCLAAVVKATDLSSKSIFRKWEQLLSFIMSVIVGGAGCYFAYSSLERLMYPTPVSFTVKYLVILIATAAAKLLLFAIFRYAHKKNGSPVIKIMSVDSLLDFFITSATVLTLIMSYYEAFSFDAVCGIVISIIIIVSAVKMIVSETKKLIGHLPEEARVEAESRIRKTEGVEDIISIEYIYDGDEPVAYIQLKTLPDADIANIKEQIRTDSEIRVKFIDI